MLDASGDGFNLPLGTNMLTFTFAYLAYGMQVNNVVKENLFSYMFFFILLGLDTIWNYANSCYSAGQLIFAGILGMSAGFIWGGILNGSNAKHLLYFSALSKHDVCSRPSKQTFKCEVYKNGKKIATKMSN